MATAELPGIVAVSRAVVSAAAELVAGVERAMSGDGKVRTAQDNAWEALQADRARAQARAEMDQLVAALLATPSPTIPERRTPRTPHPALRDPHPPLRDLGVVVGTEGAISR